MANRRTFCSCLFALVFVAAITAAGTILQPDYVGAQNNSLGNDHPGEVREEGGQAALKATVDAWKTGKRTEDDDECPQYGEILDSTESDVETGEFVVRIPSEYRLYNIVYCETGYHNLVYTRILNDESGKNVIPTPVYMKKQSTTDEERQAEAQQIMNATTIEITYFLNQIANLSRINSAAVNSAFDAYAEMVLQDDSRAAEAVEQLKQAIPLWVGEH